MVKEKGMAELMTPQQVADMLQINKQTVYKWTREGFLPNIRLGKTRVRYSRKKLEQWLDTLAHPGRNKRLL